MEKIKIITDSTLDLPSDLIKEKNIEVLPLLINFGEESYLDGVEINTKEMLEKIKRDNVLPTTAQVTPNRFEEVFKKYLDEGYKIVILGDEKHPEVVGINGWCNNDAIITKDGSFNDNLPNKICVVSQTTEKEENWDKTIDNLSKESIDELKSFNTICAATEERQKSVYDLSKNVDFMIVVGGKHSSNTTKLYQIAKENCPNTIHIENASELPKDLLENKNIKNIGITAGASTPDWIIKEVVKIMEGL